MSISSDWDKIRIRLWVKSGGRCAYCNEPLWRDDHTMSEMNGAYVAHIIAESPNGPRGNKVRSPQLAKDYSNIILMCDKHHRLIDTEDVKGHPEVRLLKMKKEHESRIELLTSFLPENKTHTVIYCSNIGQINPLITFKQASQAIINEKFYPSEPHAIELSLGNSQMKDNEDLFWEIEAENLMRHFKDKIESKRYAKEIKRFSLFAMAPQPLLIKLGSLFTNLYDLDVYQKHREPSTWNWQDTADFNEFEIIPPDNMNGIPALNLSLSATITNDRIKELFDEEVSIWTITHNNPGLNFLKTKIILGKFREICREFLDKVKSVHGQKNTLHVFPAMPVSAAVEFGRIWMPKADLNLTLYDQNKDREGFYKSINLNQKP